MVPLRHCNIQILDQFQHSCDVNPTFGLITSEFSHWSRRSIKYEWASAWVSYWKSCSGWGQWPLPESPAKSPALPGGKWPLLLEPFTLPLCHLLTTVSLALFPWEPGFGSIPLLPSLSKLRNICNLVWDDCPMIWLEVTSLLLFLSTIADSLVLGKIFFFALVTASVWDFLPSIWLRG